MDALTSLSQPRPGLLDWVLAPLGRAMIAGIAQRLSSGTLVVFLPGERQPRRVDSAAPGPQASVVIHRWRALLRLAAYGSSGWYEAWAAGEWESADPVQLFALFSANRHALGAATRAKSVWKRVRRSWHRKRRNDRAGSKRNIHHHYDLGNDFYRLWLDPGMTYSSALFAEPVSAAEPLEEAQRTKLLSILSRTATRPGERILEIGCGWGSFAEVAARAGVQVHGITLSTEQKAWAEERIVRQGLTGVAVTLTDYRDVTGVYDAIVSIEMVEAVGEEFWPDYLGTIACALKPGGRAAIQYIAIDDAIFPGYAENVDFIQRYVFPGGMLVSESRFQAIAAEQGLRWQDRLGFGLHYAETLKRWREQFDRVAAEGGLPAQFDERFIRLWRYYLMYCEGGFRGGGIDVAQVTLVKA